MHFIVNSPGTWWTWEDVVMSEGRASNWDFMYFIASVLNLDAATVTVKD